MCVAAAIVGGAVIGGIATSDAAGKAAKAQTKASDQSIAFQRESRDLALELQRPQREAGYAATAALLDLTGIPRGGPSRQPITIDGATGHVFPHSLSRSGASVVGRAFRNAEAPNTAAPNLADYPKYTFQADPGYQFRFDEGNRALERGAAARGGLLSGGFARKAIRYAQDYTSNEYQNVYNRIAAIAGFRTSAASNGTNIVFGTGQGVGNALTNAGEARASGYVAQGNAWANSINQITGAWGSGMFGNGGQPGTQAVNYGGPMYGGGLA